MLYNTNHGATNANSESNATNNPAPVQGSPATGNNPAPVQKAPAPMFKHLRAAVIKESNEKKRATVFYIKSGYFKTWSEHSKNESLAHSGKDRAIKEYLTATKYTDYTSGKITRARAIEIATARAFKDIDKQTAKKLSLITAAENAPALNAVNISVEWARSSVWGYNPTATATAYSITDDGAQTYDEKTGRASGCGYDKQSAAISESLNKIPAVLKVLYLAEEKRLKGRESRKQARRDFIGYGAGYGVLPYFEGGCGVSVYHKIFKSCGYVFKCVGSGKTYDAYTITKEGDARK